MYATWLDYNKITNMGANTEVLRFGEENKFTWMISPLNSQVNRSNGYFGNGELNMIDGIVFGGGVKQSHQAHPALNSGKIMIASICKKDKIAYMKMKGISIVWKSYLLSYLDNTNVRLN